MIASRKLVSALLVSTAALWAIPAAAQESGSTFCAEDEDIRSDAETIARSHPLVEAGYRLAETGCDGVNYLRRLFRSEPDIDQVTADEVFEAATPPVDYDALIERGRRNAEADERRERELAAIREQDARRRNARDDYPIDIRLGPGPDYTVLPPDREGGFIRIFQQGADSPPPDPAAPPPTDPSQISGAGVLLTPDGFFRGNLVNGQLQGPGEELSTGGILRLGEFEDGELDGWGIEVGQDNGTYYVMETEFIDGTPDGVAEITYEDGRTRNDVWYGGNLVAQGTFAAAGEQLVTPEFFTPAQRLAMQQQAFEAQLERAANAGALFALADEMEEQGNADQARLARRALIRRFPDSQLASIAATRLSAGGTPQGIDYAPRTNGGQPGFERVTRGTPQPPSSQPRAAYSSVCMRDMSQLQNVINQQGKVFYTSRGYYDALLQVVSRCGSYDPEAAEEVRIKQSERGMITANPSDPDVPWLQGEVNRIVSNPNYSAVLGPYRLGPGGAGNGGSTANPSLGGGTSGGAYRTVITDMILAPSFHARFNGRGLPVATCQQQEQANLSYVSSVPSAGTMQDYRKIAAALELGMAIYKQCEDDPTVWRQIQQWQQTRAQALDNCRQVASSEAACLARYRD